MAGDTVRLYTRQNDKTLLMLEHGGRILNQRVYVQLHFGDMAKHYLECYDWFSREAAKRVPKPDISVLKRPMTVNTPMGEGVLHAPVAMG